MWQQSPSFVIGAVIVLAVIFVAVFPQVFTPVDPNVSNPSAMLLPPSALHWFGTDNYGRDLFARVVYGTRIDLLIGIGCVVVPFAFGSLLGLVAGYYGGRIDAIIMRILDVFMAFPFLVMVIAVVAILGSGTRNLLIAMWVVGWKEYTRLIRSEVMVAKQSEYVQSARTMGYSDLRIMLRHILPNVISTAIVYGASHIVMCMGTAASLSYLGIGVQPPTPEWGAIINGGKSFITTAWWITVIPGAVLALVGWGFSILGDGLSDLLRADGH
ncbi:Glutathione transport system permease protein GsiD [bioreactor metagenome]|uniref:Glutathione transport system permease protein GsiD n=1 Tax=bioreactor metagenome TaxID=1076179 RepID=A0A644WE11_9ZZZZ